MPAKESQAATSAAFSIGETHLKIVDWTPEGKYEVGDLVTFPESMCPPGQPRTWRVAEVSDTFADGYKWEEPRLIAATH